MILKDKVIIITSNEPWGDIWYTKHNYAFELSKRNRVFFVNPPNGWREGLKSGHKILENKITKSLSVLNYNNYLPLLNFKHRGTSDPYFTNRANNFLISKKLNSFLKKKGFDQYFFWSFDPLRLYDPELLNSSLNIFHCADQHWLNSFGTHILCKKSDVLFLTSKHLFEEYSGFDIPKNLVPHGISDDQFFVDEDALSKIDMPVKDFGLFVGVIDGRVDYKLLDKVLSKFPDQAFVFVGPLKENHIYEESYSYYKKIFIEKSFHNLYHLGPKHFKTLKYYIYRSRFCISFMDPKWPGNTIGHHKTLVYLAQGKPVFQYLFKDYIGCEEILYMSENHEETIEQLSRFVNIGEPDSLIDQRKSFASKSRFESLINDIDSYLKNNSFG